MAITEKDIFTFKIIGKNINAGTMDKIFEEVKKIEDDPKKIDLIIESPDGSIHNFLKMIGWKPDGTKCEDCWRIYCEGCERLWKSK